MKFNILIQEINDPSSKRWENNDEEDVKTEADAIAYGERIVKYWNNTLRPNDIPREFLGKVQITTEESIVKHQWKKTSMVTEINGKDIPHDKYKCEKCGITGKRYSLEALIVKRDSLFRAKRYKECHPENLDENNRKSEKTF